MALNVHNFQPGAALHQCITSVLHSRGITILAMCEQLGFSMNEARYSTLGMDSVAQSRR